MKIITAAIILPIFLLGLTPVQSPTAKADIIFALRDKHELPAISFDYSLNDTQTVFEGGNGLLPTFKAKADYFTSKQMASDGRIAYIEQDAQVRVSAVVTNDPFFTTDSTLEDKQWYLAKIKVADSWNYGTGSNSVTVAIIDTGIHAGHIELDDGRITGGYNTMLNQAINPGANSDDNGHGTAVAGVIGGIANNGRGIAGINWNVRLMPIKALEADGTGVISSVASGIVWAADNGANIINLSLGGYGFGADQTLNNAVSYAYNKGVLIVAAAGNDLADQGVNLDQSPVYPVCSDLGKNMVLGVAATDYLDHKAAFSNFGINCVDLTAPGKKILTTTYLPSNPADNLLIYGSGTSLATPVVSGIAALVKANNQAFTNDQLRDILLKTGDNIDSLNTNNCLNTSCAGFLGKGRINAFAALAPKPIGEGTLVKDAFTGQTYFITGGVKRLVIDYVFNQRGFSSANMTLDTNGQLSVIPLGAPLPPLEGTLIKAESDPTVFVINQELKRPLTYLVFVSRGYSFANVVTLPKSYVDMLTAGDWYWPPDGTMVLIKGNPTVYVMDKQVRRAVTYFVFIQRKLSFTKVISVTPDEFSHVPAPADPYWLPPLDGTLVKSSSHPTVYVIEGGALHALSYNAFVARGYKFSSIKTLPQAEIEVITPGSAIL